MTISRKRMTVAISGAAAVLALAACTDAVHMGDAGVAADASSVLDARSTADGSPATDGALDADTQAAGDSAASVDGAQTADGSTASDGTVATDGTNSGDASVALDSATLVDMSLLQDGSTSVDDAALADGPTGDAQWHTDASELVYVPCTFGNGNDPTCPQDYDACRIYGGGSVPHHCTFACAASATCPTPSTGSADLVCDTVQDGKLCALDCAGGKHCPEGMSCVTITDEGDPIYRCAYR